jgi:hypothetical protein
MSQDTKELKLAVLIDADNVPYSNVKGWEEIAKYGTPTTKRIYADWTKPNGMENCFVRICNHTNSASYTVERTRQIQRFIDAMDLLYSDKVDGFIVSSDSDFTRLAIRLKRIWHESYRNGEKNTNSFIVACDRFIYIEVLDGAIQKKKQNGQVLQTKNQLEKKNG